MSSKQGLREEPDLIAEVNAGLREAHKATIPKQMIVMRKDLKMRKGKMIAQGAHASMKVFFDRIPQDVRDVGVPRGYKEIRVPMEINRSMGEWLFGIFTKICVSVDSEAELLDVYERAKAARLPCALIQDAGLTEFDGVPTITCCAIGPAYPQDIDPVTDKLKLL